MADNVSVTPGSGANIATDQAGDGSHMQIVKVAYSADGDKTPVQADANGLAVQVKSIGAGASVKVTADTALPVDASSQPIQVFNKTGTKLQVRSLANDPLYVQLTDGTAPITGIPISGDVGADQGAPGTLANAWNTALTDGTNRVGVTLITTGVYGLKVAIEKIVDLANIFINGAAWVSTATKGALGMGFRQDVLDSDLGDSKVGAVRLTPKYGQHVNLRTNAGVELGTDANPILTAPSSTAGNQPVSGTVSAKLLDNGGTAFSSTNPLQIQTGVGARTRVTTYLALVGSQSAAAFWTPANGKKFVITKLILNVSVAGTLNLRDGNGGDYVFNGAWPVGAFVIDFTHEPWASKTVDSILRYTSGTAITGDLTAHGFEI